MADRHTGPRPANLDALMRQINTAAQAARRRAAGQKTSTDTLVVLVAARQFGEVELVAWEGYEGHAMARYYHPDPDADAVHLGRVGTAPPPGEVATAPYFVRGAWDAAERERGVHLVVEWLAGRVDHLPPVRLDLRRGSVWIRTDQFLALEDSA